jgi:hypothetical protein
MRLRIVSAAAVVVISLLVFDASASAAKYDIVPGQSIGRAELGMTRKATEQRLKGLAPPTRTQVGQVYSLGYSYPLHEPNGNPGGPLQIAFFGLSRNARSVSMLTIEPTLATVPEHVGIGDRHDELLAAYPGIDCYHSATDVTRDHEIDTTENYECELRKNGGFTYFSFASLDADPGQQIGAIAIASRRID